MPLSPRNTMMDSVCSIPAAPITKPPKPHTVKILSKNGQKDNKQLLALLIETVSKGGNLLLNDGCTQAPPQFKAPENTILTYNPASHRLYIHLLAWPMETIVLEGYAGKVKYAQFLHDGSEIILKPKRETTWMDETAVENELVAEIPITKPPVEVPVIELFLKD